MGGTAGEWSAMELWIPVVGSRLSRPSSCPLKREFHSVVEGAPLVSSIDYMLTSKVILARVLHSLIKGRHITCRAVGGILRCQH